VDVGSEHSQCYATNIQFLIIFADAGVCKKQNEKTRLMMDVLIVLNGQHAESNDYFLGNDR
jgi:hypothetical protein